VDDGVLLTDPGEAAEKVVVCPPRAGVVQISSGGMGPTDVAPEVEVTVAADRRSIVVENT